MLGGSYLGQGALGEQRLQAAPVVGATVAGAGTISATGVRTAFGTAAISGTGTISATPVLVRVDFFLVAGASNATGEGGNSALSTVCPPGQGYEYKSGTIHEIVDPVTAANTGSAWPAFCAAYNAATGRVAVIIQKAIAGSAQTVESDVGNGNWTPSGTLWSSATTAYDNAITDLEGEGYTVNVAGVLWSEGGREAKEIDLAVDTKANYKSAFTAMIARFRTHYGSTLPFYFFRTGYDDTTGDTSGYQQIRAAQEEVDAADLLTYDIFLDAVNFEAEGLSNGQHYTQAGYNKMGHDGAEALADIQSQPALAFSLNWDLNVPVDGTVLDLTWDLVGTVDANALRVNWDLRAETSLTLSLLWDAPTTVDEALALVWDLTGEGAERELSLAWDLQASADGPERIVKWDLRAAVGQERTLVWDTYAKADAGSLEILWDQGGLVNSAPLRAVWDLIAEVGQTQTLIWDLRTSATADALRVLWDLNAAVAKSVSLKWDLAADLARQLSLSWDIRNPVTGEVLALPWVLRAAANQSLTLSWDLYAERARQLDLIWNLSVSPGDLARELVFVWDVNNSASRPLWLRWRAIAVQLDLAAPASGGHLADDEIGHLDFDIAGKV